MEHLFLFLAFSLDLTRFSVGSGTIGEEEKHFISHILSQVEDSSFVVKEQEGIFADLVLSGMSVISVPEDCEIQPRYMGGVVIGKVNF